MTRLTRQEIWEEKAARPDMWTHTDGCEEDECLAACEQGRCRCAGCAPHLDDDEEEATR